MELKNLSKEQAIEIAKLAYRKCEWIQSEFDFKYIPYEASDVSKQIYEDTPEMVQVFFNAFTFGEKIEKIRVIIYANLDISLNIIRNNPFNLITIEISNQYKIVERFINWGVEPKYSLV